MIKNRALKLILSILFFNIFFNPIYLFSAPSEFIHIDTKIIQEYDEGFRCLLRIPYINTDFKSNLKKDFNNELLTLLTSKKDAVQKNSKDYVVATKSNGYTVRPFVISSDFTVPLNDNDLLSIKNVVYEYTAGAHGYYYFVTHSLDFSNNTKLSLEELFKPNYDYNGVIYSEILKETNKNPKLYFKEYITDMNKLPKTEKFYLEPGFIVVYYDLYEIAPFASGIPEFKIPISVFGDNILYKF